MSDSENRVFPGEADELEPDEVLSAANAVMKDRWLSIFIQLNNSTRFQHFLANNFVITDKIDEEAKTIETLVIENPMAVGPVLSSEQRVTAVNVLKMANCPDPLSVWKKLITLLGQEDVSPIIASATDSDVKDALDA